MRVMALGDVCGDAGLSVLRRHLRSVIKLHGIDLVVCNAENADVMGIRPQQAAELLSLGADVITTGNHVWRRREITNMLDGDGRIIRPANFPAGLPGTGMSVLTTPKGYKLGVINLIGRYNCDWNADSPFTVMDAILKQKQADYYIVDFHAEATSEKKAMGYFLDGRASAVFGTHTHVQTSDVRILPDGTGYITDLGMCGAYESVLGIKIEHSLNTFLGGLPVRYECPDSPGCMEGAVFEIEEPSGRCVSAEALKIM